MTEIGKDIHPQVFYEQYKIAVVDYFIVECPYCGVQVETDSTRHAICQSCNSIIQLFSTEQEAEKYLNRSQEAREFPDKPLNKIFCD